MIDALYRSLGSLRAWVTFIIGAVAATATWRSPSRANAAAPLGAASSSLSHRKHTLPLLALLAAAALGLALLLPGGVLQAQDGTIEYAENGTEPVATFTADDPEGATSVTWALATDDELTGTGGIPASSANADRADFMIDKDGVLKFNIAAPNNGSSAGSPDFENAQGGASSPFNNTYNVVVKATDDGGAIGYHEVTVKVTDVDEPGKVTWTVDPDGGDTHTPGTPKLVQFQVGASLSASATDGDIAGPNTAPAAAPTAKPVTSPIWRWYRSPSKASIGTLIEDENGASYTVGLADVGMYLTAVAHYVVAGNVDQDTASLTSDYPVMAGRVGDNKLKFDPDEVELSVAEGDDGATVGTVTATGNHGTVNYSFGDPSTGVDNGKFKIDQKTGQITTAEDLDYEATDVAANCVGNDDTCLVTIRATDASGSATVATADPAVPTFADVEVTIKITNVDEEPDFQTGTDSANPMAVTAITVPENSTVLFHADAANNAYTLDEAADVTYTAMDPETRNIVYSLTGPDGAKFKLSSTQVLSFKSNPDYENPGDANRDNVYEVTVRASDSTTQADRMVRVTVADDDEAPEITGSDSVNFAENGAGNVATFTADDPEGSTSITWGLADATLVSNEDDLDTADNADAGHFEIDPDDGVLKFDIDAANDGSSDGSPDFENPQGAGTPLNNTYNVVVTAADTAATPNVGFHKVTVKVTNVSEPGKMTWAVNPGAGDSNPTLVQFQVGAILTATATDGDIAGAAKQVGDASGVATTDVSNLRWQWYRGGSLITATGADDNTYTVTNDDIGSRIRVVATYQVGGSTVRETAALTSDYSVLATRDGSSDLKFSPSTVSRSVAEGEKGRNVGAPVTATGNHGAVNYALATGGDNDRFKIDQKSGQITTAVDLDREGTGNANCANPNACVVTVNATDASGDTATTAATVNIEITGVDDPPKFVEDTTASPPAASPTSIGVAEKNKELHGTPAEVTYRATDEDGLNVNLTLMGPDAARFTLNAAGVLSFVKAPDYENPADANRDNVYEVTVRASDGTLHTDQMVKVTVTNVNEAPAIIAGGLVVSGPVSRSIEENTPATTAVATYRAAGPDAASATWSLSGADSGDFRLSNSGVLNFRTSPNFERPADANGDNVYEVTVTANDGTNTAMRNVTVTVTDVEEQGTGDALVDRYDVNPQNSVIDKAEVITAINDYLDAESDAPSKADVIRLINLYLDS